MRGKWLFDKPPRAMNAWYPSIWAHPSPKHGIFSFNKLWDYKTKHMVNQLWYTGLAILHFWGPLSSLSKGRKVESRLGGKKSAGNNSFSLLPCVLRNAEESRSKQDPRRDPATKKLLVIFRGETILPLGMKHMQSMMSLQSGEFSNFYWLGLRLAL